MAVISGWKTPANPAAPSETKTRTRPNPKLTLNAPGTTVDTTESFRAEAAPASTIPEVVMTNQGMSKASIQKQGLESSDSDKGLIISVTGTNPSHKSVSESMPDKSASDAPHTRRGNQPSLRTAQSNEVLTPFRLSSRQLITPLLIENVAKNICESSALLVPFFASEAFVKAVASTVVSTQVVNSAVGSTDFITAVRKALTHDRSLVENFGNVLSGGNERQTALRRCEELERALAVVASRLTNLGVRVKELKGFLNTAPANWS